MRERERETLTISFLSLSRSLSLSFLSNIHTPKVEAVLDGWLYDHELVALKNFARALAVLAGGGFALARALTRPPAVDDPTAVAQKEEGGGGPCPRKRRES